VIRGDLRPARRGGSLHIETRAASADQPATGNVRR
jgi:hypothetical protein